MSGIGKDLECPYAEKYHDGMCRTYRIADMRPCRFIGDNLDQCPAYRDTRKREIKNPVNSLGLWETEISR